MHCIVKIKFLNGLYKINSLFVKECFRNVRYDIRFRKLGLCQDCDVLVDSDCLRYDIYSKFQSLCRL